MNPLRMRWLGTACFEIVLPNGKTLVIDPFVDDSVSSPITSDQFEGCDYLFLTHGHYDHILDAGKLAARFNPVIYCSQLVSESLAVHLGVNSDQVRTVTAGDIVRVNGMTIEVIQGTHVEFISDYKRLTGKEFQPETPVKEAIETTVTMTFETDWRPPRIEEWMAKFPQGEQLNYVFEPDQGPRVYMAGTRPDPNQIKIAGDVQADITLLQVPPANALKGLEKSTADLAIASGCRVCVPQHHDPLLKGAKKTDLGTLKTLLSGIRFQELVSGKWYVFDGKQLNKYDAC
jgi:L-ascorbate metabolism protein UlaG (beta-lactamase superfamily)